MLDKITTIFLKKASPASIAIVKMGSVGELWNSGKAAGILQAVSAVLNAIGQSLVMLMRLSITEKPSPLSSPRWIAKPAKQIMDQFYAAGKLTSIPFDEKIEWTYFELWHHEGRRARHGAAMMGPDFTQWHGFYEVAKHFYTKFLPECEELQPGASQQILESEYHQWKAGLSNEQKERILNFYRQRYGQ